VRFSPQVCSSPPLFCFPGTRSSLQTSEASTSVSASLRFVPFFVSFLVKTYSAPVCIAQFLLCGGWPGVWAAFRTSNPGRRKPSQDGAFADFPDVLTLSTCFFFTIFPPPTILLPNSPGGPLSDRALCSPPPFFSPLSLPFPTPLARHETTFFSPVFSFTQPCSGTRTSLSLFSLPPPHVSEV